MYHSRVFVLACLSVMPILFSCEKDKNSSTEETVADSIVLDAEAVEVEVGKTVKITPTVTSANSDVVLSWTSTDVNVATVEGGVVTGVAKGEAIITASFADVSAKCTVTVIAPAEIGEGYAAMVLIHAADSSFMMGSPETEANRTAYEPQHPVKFTKDFYMGKYEVTAALFAEYANAAGITEDGKFANNEEITGSKWTNAIYPSDKGCYCQFNKETGKWEATKGYENYPIGGISWFAANEYAKWKGGSLPTEAQWEYACRAGSTTAYPFGDDPALLSEYAWYITNADKAIQEVGQLKPNAWGLYDMLGNTNEFCSDWFHKEYGLTDFTTVVVDPQGPEKANQKVVRGGTVNYTEAKLRSASRDWSNTSKHMASFGFRIVMPVE